MTVERATPRHSGAEPAVGQAAVVRAVTAIMGTVVGLTFLFGFGNVLDLALRLGVPIWVAPLVAPAVDLSILGLLLGTRHLVLHGAELDSLRDARRLLIFSSMVTLALNVADPLVRGQFGKAAFDAVGPLLLIGWAEVGPSLLHALGGSGRFAMPMRDGAVRPDDVHAAGSLQDDLGVAASCSGPSDTGVTGTAQGPEIVSDLLERAREEDLRHRMEHQRPISAETLRRRLRIGAVRSRQLVAQVRLETQSLSAPAALSTSGRS